MPNKILVPSWGVAVLALSVAFSTPAFAGFQWVSPSDGSTHSSVAVEAPLAETSSDQAVGSPEVVSPIVGLGSGSVSTTKTTSKDAYLAAPTFAAPEPQNRGGRIDLATETVRMPPSKAMPAGEVVQGFASDVPLALALRQILPAGYSFSVEEGVDLNTLVSYQGGRPWGDVLRETLKPVGLTGHQQGTVVAVRRAGRPMHRQAAATPVPLDGRQRGGVFAVSSEAPVIGKPMVNMPSARGWTANRGDTLRKVLERWCRRAGFELKWLAEYDYPVEASVQFSGGFEDAVRSLLAGFDGARPQPVGTLHANAQAGQRVLVIQVRGNSYTN